jgi:uncharacterized protein YraI|nr:MAG TPA: N-acetylmuramoyl-L-alanine amidase [Caudoviricetes sp.]
MSYSNLTSAYLPASSRNYTQGRRGYKICKITPHHMAGRLTAAQCANIFKNPARQASSNYGIGYNGEIACYVDEENRAWTSSNRANDCQAITIEVANSSTGGDWPISDASWNALVKLCVDICKRHNFRLEYDGTPNGSLTRHDMFANTNCPGPYLKSRLPELARVVNAKLDGSSTPEPSPSPAPTTGYTVKVTTDVLNIRKGPGTNFAITGQIKDKGTYTIVKESDGPGASKWGKLKSGAGWISLDYTSKKSSGSSKPSGKVLGLYVVNTPSGLNVRKGPGTNYSRIKTYTNGTRFDTYEIDGDWARTPSGWVNLNYCSLVKAY